MSGEQLKPCPFCGSDDLYICSLPMLGKGKEVSGWVGCNKCGVHMEKHKLKEAIKAWNRRTNENA